MAKFTGRLAELNSFELNAQGVWQAKGTAAAFNYSDGAQSEKALHEILSKAEDLSSDSLELQEHIEDWPTEYHLSVTRSNLLRALDLHGVKRVLELGCGCGSITRYLGEQSQITVDSVEGSPTRAGLARLRCREMQNVQISTANFNDIELPVDEYDLVLFVGVTEYAGRFSNEKTDQAALNALLENGRRACKKGGAVVVAIENRLGMKYALGASEDHYGLPYVGIDEYPQADGIRTYSKDEWLEHISAAGFDKHRLLLPFPDYKIPTLLMQADYRGKEVGPALAKVRSRDYVRPFNTGDSMGHGEGKLWRSMLQANTLAEHSNSFLWLLGDDDTALAQLSKEPLMEFDATAFDYQPQAAAAFVECPPNDADQIEHLQAEINQLKSHSKSLEGRVDLMSNSIGWRILDRIRRLFRRTTL